ncbi:CBS domain protein [Ostertagia ostertagi]
MSHSESVSPLRSHLTIGPHSQSLRSPMRTPFSHAHTYSVRERSINEVLHYEPDSYARLLQMNQCYEAMPTSSKMVIFDTELVLWKAFNGLVYQNTRHVLLSNGERGGLITGILSVTDFIRVMLRLRRERGQADALVDDKQDLGKLTIQKYRELVQKEGKLKELVYINANNSLLEAARLLAQHRIHRLPVLDPESGSPLFILTHKRLLKFLWCFGQQFSQPDYHIRTAKDLNVGSWVGIRVVFPDTPLTICLDILLNKGVSGVPVVFPDTPLTICLDILLNKGVSGVPVVERDTFKVIDMYSRFDAVGIALEESADSLDVSVEQALKFKNLGRNDQDRVVSVRDTDTLWKAITVLVERNVHRLCAVNEKGAIEASDIFFRFAIADFLISNIGIISLSDVINHMVVKPGANLKPIRVPRRHYTSHPYDCSDVDLRNRLQDSATLLEDTATGKLRKDISNLSLR